MRKRTKAWIVIGSVMGGLALALGGFIIFALSPISPFIPRGGGLVKIDAKKIGKTATLVEKKVKVKDHEFTYYNVKSDIQFGFRYKNAGTKIVAYDKGMEPRDMGPFYEDETYNSYQVGLGFKITIDESLDINNVNLGIFEHWC